MPSRTPPAARKDDDLDGCRSRVRPFWPGRHATLPSPGYSGPTAAGHRPQVTAVTPNSLAEDRRGCVGAAMEGLPARAGMADCCDDLWLRASGRRAAARRARRGIAASGGAVGFGPAVGLARRVRVGLRGVFGDDPASFPVRREWLNALLQKTTWHLGARSKAVERQDPADVRPAAHTLKGVAANLCATSVAELCGKLEGVHP